MIAIPKGVPLTTMPATLWQIFRTARRGQYANCEQGLILLDARALLVVDFIRDVIP